MLRIADGASAPVLHCRVFYFAYGSNLDLQNWNLWCANKGFDADSIDPLGPAWLPDHELVFHYQSRLRKGGALDIRPRRGAVIPGALFRVHDWEGLDAKEGVFGRYYRRISVTALTDDGRAHAATTYCVCEERVGPFVPPSPAYREIVARGLSRFGHGHEAFLEAASNTPASPIPSAIFTYGTLMSGERNHGLLASQVLRAHGSARVADAALLQIDWYPGLVLSQGGTVHGELYELDDVAAALQELDSYEDFMGYESPTSLYRRSLINAVTPSGSALAWTYVFLGDAGQFPLIPSGRWSGA
ncbi:MAG: gamma-glutamylcyclotransferase [Myxococcales bacterium]|nr:gamma-glutamylcyclotransferase [Myxococcales bacterium]